MSHNLIDTPAANITAVERDEVPLVANISTNHTAGGMTFLDMLRRLRVECGVSGSTPSTALNLSGEMGRLAGYINAAWLDIQNMHDDWKWMRQPFSFVTAADKQKYNQQEMLIASYGSIDKDSITIHSVNDHSDEMILPFMSYDQFRYMYMFGQRAQEKNRPVVFTIDDQDNLLLGSRPDRQYVVGGFCYAMPTEFTADDQRPAMPGQYHLAIVYRAMMLYAQYEGAPEVFAHGATEFNKYAARLASRELPTVTFGEPLA